MSFKSDRNVDTLYMLCLNKLVDSLHASLVTKKHRLPTFICDDLLDLCTSGHDPSFDRVFHLFQDPAKRRLSRARFYSMGINDFQLDAVLKHGLERLELTDCYRLSSDSFENILRNGANIKTLKLGKNAFGREYHKPKKRKMFVKYRLNKLEHLEILECEVDLADVFEPLDSVTHLNLSEHSHFYSSGLGDLGLQNLCVLILRDVAYPEYLSDIIKLTKLQHLDVAHTRQHQRQVGFEEVLELIVMSLPDLEYLDVSGTAMTLHKQTPDGCTLYGLESRIDRPFKFLGVCYPQLCDDCNLMRPDGKSCFPALKVAGYSNLEQLLNAGMTHIDSVVCVKVYFYTLMMYLSTVRHYPCKALPVSTAICKRHIKEQFVVMSYMTLLNKFDGFNLLELDDMPLLKDVVSVVLTVIESNDSLYSYMESVINLLPLIHQIVSDTFHEYDKFLVLMVRIISQAHGVFLQLAIPIFLSLTEKIDTPKRLEGIATSVIQRMLNLLRMDIAPIVNDFDDMFLSIAWLVLFKFTNGFPEISNVFVELDGIQSFVLCFQTFPTHVEYLAPMLGTISNVAKVKSLRAKLRIEPVYRILNRVLMRANTSVESAIARFNTMEIVAYLATDESPDPQNKQISMDRSLKLMKNALFERKYDYASHIKYTSLSSIIMLLATSTVPESLLWAIWVLAYLLEKDDGYYANLLISENGIPIIKETYKKSIAYIDSSANKSKSPEETITVHGDIVNLIHQIVSIMNKTNAGRDVWNDMTTDNLGYKPNTSTQKL